MTSFTQDRVTRLEGRRESTDEVQDSPWRRAAILEFNRGLGTLARAVERDVIPQLVVSHRAGVAGTPFADLLLPNRGDVVELTGLLASGDFSAARARVESKRQQGLSLETLYLHLLVPAARRLSDLWEADLCQYEEIAVGLLNLRQMLRDYSAAFCAEDASTQPGRKALLMSSLSEQSLLGVFLVSEFCRCVTSEFFHRAGWDVWHQPPASREELREILRRNWFDLVDISATCDSRLPDLAADIDDIRSHSRNRAVQVTVGGPLFADHPDWTTSARADGHGCHARDTLEQAERLFALRDNGRSGTYY